MPRPNKGASLAQNEFGIYEVRWSHAGRTKRVSTRTSSLPDAQRFLAGWILESERSQSSSVAVSAVLDAYDEGHLSSGKVADAETARLRMKVLREHFGDLIAAEIDARDVRAYVKARTTGRLGRRVSNATVRRELGILVAALNRAARDRLISKGDVPYIELPEGSAPRDYWLTDEELDRLQAAAQPAGEARLTRIARFVAIARYTAARKDAIERLTWFQVDLDRGVIDFRQKGERVTKKRKAVVPIADELMPILRRAKDEAKSGHVLDFDGAIRTAFRTAAKAAGLPRATPHTLRHSWATLAAQRGVSMFDIAGVLGDTVATVQKTYAHHSPDYLRGAVNSGRNPGVTPGSVASFDQQRPTRTQESS